ncbi:SRPBCC family protein [Sulfuriflexus sp.]|uniref:SRPBCC family protein n=1 Tax=Sulfuriflexus sp. TaxID=2015443 RepID=UPI0028CC5745|nr:SRPBCC family protein [Sulfuriflexus sp.]MDT8405062.1 SRPBCC family protein [Sulfuriflexus sp.]
MINEQITIDTVIAAPPEIVWQYWTEPDHIMQWNFASDDWCCQSAENDLKVGGQYRARMEAKDGSFGFDFEAVYDEVSAPNTLTYTMADGRKVATNFEAQGRSTKVTTIFDAEQENAIDMQRDGWQAILNNFKSYVESQQTTREEMTT